MQNPDLPTLPTLSLEQVADIPANWDFAADTGLVLLVPQSERKASLATTLSGSPWADFLAARLADYSEATNPVVTSGPQGHRIVVVFVADDASSFKTLSLARKLIAPLLTERVSRINAISLLKNKRFRKRYG